MKTFNRDKLLILIPVLLLFGEFGYHSFLMKTEDVPRWNGPGFAVYSTLDSTTTRPVRIEISTVKEKFYIDVKNFPIDDLDDIRNNPSAASNDELLLKVLREQYLEHSGLLTPVKSGDCTPLTLKEICINDKLVAITTIKTTVYRLEFNRSESKLERFELWHKTIKL